MGIGEASAQRATAMRGDCLTCVKYLMIMFNTFLGMAGCFLVGVSLLVLLGTKTLYGFLMLHPVLSLTVYAVLTIGAMLFVLGFLGCIGAIRENRCLLFFYFLLICILFIAELSAGVWGYVYRAKLSMASFKEDLATKYNGLDPNDSFTSMWNDWMERHKCCGVEGPKDFEETDFYKKKLNLTKIPKECCIERTKNVPQGVDVSVECLDNLNQAYIHQQGCHEVAFTTYEFYIYMALALAILVLIFELFAMFIAMCLFRGLLKM
ncbi:tetraspanin-18B-like isoform X2 [Syngnathoides biaculeatus]|uniref:tetraspanin-18B-like isoform X2 n=1 Tax=Syngnathoides biaculeatus TaxID=300417 RepID=UPI002ADE177F|nr:tetraspanin-18B-like isoform X2 [Syngnathoides biaculeatus]XP_061679478.1 tetraspanin-18B-like isoform X2 [Syngnathoides biaculeatus]